MELREDEVDRWLERGGKFFKAVARNPVIRGELLMRGLTDEELLSGWRKYAGLNGFATERPGQLAVQATAAGEAIAALDAWDAPNFNAARAVLDSRHPAVSRFVFNNLAPAEGAAAVGSVSTFVERIAQLRAGLAGGVDPDEGRAAVALLATRKIIDERREAELRTLIETAQRGARPEELIAAQEADPRKQQAAAEYIAWLREWREVARAAITRRDYRIALGLAQRRRSQASSEADESDDDAA